MPNAQANTSEHVRKELKSLPEGYVVLRKMNYGERLEMRDLAMVMQGDDKSARMRMNSRETNVFEFKVCIIEHNLEDAQGRPLDFKRPEDVLILEPKVAQEIERYLNEMNSAFDPGEGREGFPTESSGDSAPENQTT